MTETLDDVVAALDGRLDTEYRGDELMVWLDDDHQICAHVDKMWGRIGFGWEWSEFYDDLSQTCFGGYHLEPSAAWTASRLTVYADLGVLAGSRAKGTVDTYLTRLIEKRRAVVDRGECNARITRYLKMLDYDIKSQQKMVDVCYTPTYNPAAR
ncbi:hypothetical protein C0Z10_09430 [Acidipropionibacterium jensenii]|uniref:Uncharacterized protein n=1 Tax=Acidipropionibacterium jensenii TaxID=1749 RepID=A0A3Q9UL70_9ACTN|nr:hypothetical protein [Acidipropionibacterium jensenii]AZZ39936.1 hypothetical protein C0Z10_09430 [Acidipropionibacterium jensenii]